MPLSTINEIEILSAHRYDNQFLYHIIFNKENIYSNIVEEIKINKSGNYYYHNISYFDIGKQIFTTFFNNIIYYYLLEKK